MQEGGITGLIGANGAGKSTTFKAILGLIHTEGGKIRIFGREVKGSDKAVLGEIGVVLSESTLPDSLTVKQMAGIMAREYPGFQMEYFAEQCSRFSVPLDKKLKEFSTGMKAKTKILLAVSHQARLLILDEPTAGARRGGQGFHSGDPSGIYGNRRAGNPHQLSYFGRSGGLLR